MKKLWIIYDGRAIPWKDQPKEVLDMVQERQRKFKDGSSFREQFFPGDTERAAVLESCSSLKEARRNAKDHGDMNCIYEYDIQGKDLINEKFVEIVP